MIRRFTGWHMAGMLIAFFGVVIGVNAVMATQAVRTFGGVVVDNSYVASQKFDGLLDAARAQRELGWTADAQLGEQGLLTVEVRGPTNAAVRVRADHPVGREPSRSLAMRTLGGGRYVSDQALPPGRWLLRVEVAADGKVARFADEVRR